MTRIRTCRHAAGYVGVLWLLGVASIYCTTLLLAAAVPRAGGNAMGSPQVAPNDGLSFDGVDDRVAFGPAPSLGVTTFTIETWFRRDGPGATATTGSGGIVAVPLVTKGMAEADGDNRDANYFLGIEGKRRVLAVDFEDTITGGNHPAFGVTPICDGIWYHAAASYDGTTWRIYLNGNLEAQVVVGAFTPRSDSIQHAALGTALNSTGNAGGAFFGALDEVRLWNVARSAIDIQASMTSALPSAPGLIGRWGLDEGTGTTTADSSGAGNNGTLLNGPTWVPGTPFVSTPLAPANYGVHLKGTAAAGDYVSFGAASGLGSPTLTVETWFKRDGPGVTTTTGTGGLTGVVPLVTKGRNDGDGSSLDINYFLGLSGNRLAADFEEGAAGAVPGLNHPISGVTTVQDNVWYHGAVTYDGVTLQLYLDGVLEAAIVVGQPPRFDSIEQAALGTALSSTGTASGFFAGTIDEARIWNYARTPAQIASGKDREIGTASGLLGRWSFNECCGQAPDSSGDGQHGTLLGTSWKWVSGAPLTGAPNTAPGIDAGADQAVTLPATALLTGSITDDGLGGAVVTTTWAKTSGPGSVTFGNAHALASTVSFSMAGTYVLALTASDGELSATDTINVAVNPAIVVNLRPVVNAGLDQAITLPAQASLAGLVTDDGLPGGDPIATWSEASGPGTVTFAQPNELTTTATFSAAGTYVLMLSANDGALVGSDTLTVTVNPAVTNKGIDLGGTNAYVTFGAAPGLGAATFTIETWFRRDGTGVTTSTGTGGVTAVPLVTKGRAESDGSNVDMNYFLGINSTGNVLTADFEEGAGAPSPGLNHPISGVTAIQNNIWYHAAVTYDGTTLRLYLNGVPDGSPLTVGRPPRSDSIQHAAIGSALTSTGAAAGFFDGVIDEVRIWSAARTAQQIADGMTGEILSAPGLLGRWGLNEGGGSTVADSSGHGISGTVVGANWSWGQGAPFNIVVNTAPSAPALNAPVNGGTSSSPATLDVSVSDADGDRMTATFQGRQKSSVAPDFTLVTIPDTQHYVDNPTFPQTFTTQTNWIVTNQSPLNIAFVSHLGDVTQNIDQFEIEWQRASSSMAVLDASSIPHGMSPGNHDETAAGVASFYDQYFPVSRFQALPWYIGYLGQEFDDPVNRQNKNNYELFSVGGLDFLIIHVEFDWPNYAVTWADKIIKRYPNRRVILSTHLFLNTSNARPTAAQFRSNGTSAEAVWQQIVKPNCNVFMVINGHYPGEGRRTDLNSCGQPVHQVLMDYQDRANGGDGWLRYFTFKPSENKIYAFTYSPTRNGGAGEFETDASSQFVLDYDMQGTPFSTIATSSNVASGARTTAVWPGLTPGTDYEWYVTLNDGKVTTAGPVWSFRAATQVNTPPVAANDAYAVNEDLMLSVAAPGVLGNDTDVDGNSLSAVLVAGPAHGALVLNANGSFSYVPAANFSGADGFTYKADDGTAGSNVATVAISVAAVNDAPVAAGQAVVVDEDTATSIALAATDPEGSLLAYTIVAGPTHGALSGSAPNVVYTPAANYNGPDSFTFKANDGALNSNIATVTITVRAVNDVPVAVNDAAATAEDTPVTIAVLANDTDPDGDILTVTGVGVPLHGTTATNSDGTIAYTPAANYNGADTFTYTIADGHGGSATGTVAIVVTAVNDAPVAVDDSVTTSEDVPVTGNVLSNDTDVDSGTTLTARVVAGPAHGTLTLNPDGSFAYAPAANFNGSDRFTYQAHDGTAWSNVATVTIVLDAVNDAPVALPDSYSATEDQPLVVIAPGVLSNDTDVEHDALTAMGVSSPAHGVLALNANGGFSYTPNALFSGSDSFTYTASDGAAESSVATVTIAVTHVNHAPLAAGDAATTAEDTPVTIAVLANDVDPDDDALTPAVRTQPLHGTAVIDPNRNVIYSPAPDYYGPDSFSYEIADGHGATATATVTVTVTAVNDAPVAVGDSYTTEEGTALTLAAPGVLGNDTDVEASTLTATLAQGPSHGTVYLRANGYFTYTPAASFHGVDSFTYRANDGALASAPATVAIAVTAMNHAPSAADQSIAGHLDAPIALTLTASDVDNDTLSYRISAQPAHGGLTGTPPALTYMPHAGFVGMDAFVFLANDGKTDSNAATVTVRVMSGINRPPEAEDQWVFIDEDTPTDVLLSAGDPEGDPLTFRIVTPPSYGTLQGTSPNLRYTPGRDFNGWDYFTFITSDGVFDSNEASVNFWVWEVNDPPVASDLQVVTIADTPVGGQLAVTDSEGDWIYYVLVSGPEHGTVAVDPDTGAFTYTPGAGSSDYERFTYMAFDWQTGGNVATVEIVSLPAASGPPSPPVP